MSTTETIAKLEAIKRRSAPRVLELCRIAMNAMSEMNAIEDKMDADAKKIMPDYTGMRGLGDYRLTFESVYHAIYDDDREAPFVTSIGSCIDRMTLIKEYATMPGAAGAAASRDCGNV